MIGVGGEEAGAGVFIAAAVWREATGGGDADPAWATAAGRRALDASAVRRRSAPARRQVARACACRARRGAYVWASCA